MTNRIAPTVVCVCCALAPLSDASAQMAVIDGASLVQLQQQVTYWQQQLDAMSAEYANLRQQLGAITGNRQMGALLPIGLPGRNYLPATANGITTAALSGAGGGTDLHSAYQTAIDAQAAVPASVANRLSPAERALLDARRASVALRSSVMQAAIATESERFAQIQQLVDTIDHTSDAKASLDLHGRIAAEQTMAATETAKVAAATGWTDATIASAQTRSRELALAEHGTFAQRFHPRAN